MNGIVETQGLPAVGEWLRRSRNEAGRSLDDVAAVLGIRTGYLEALERGELSRFFGPTYVESMVVRYALHLDIDPDDVLLRAAREPASISSPNSAPGASAGSSVKRHGSPPAASSAKTDPPREPAAALSAPAVAPPPPPVSEPPSVPEAAPGWGRSSLGNGSLPAWLAEDSPPTRLDIPEGGRWSRSPGSRSPESRSPESAELRASKPADSAQSAVEALLADLERISAPPENGRQPVANRDAASTMPESRVARNKARAVARRAAALDAAVTQTRPIVANDTRAQGDRRFAPRLSRAWVVPPLAVILVVVGLFGAQQFGFLGLFGGDDEATTMTLQAAGSSTTTVPTVPPVSSSSSVTSAAAAATVVSSTQSTILSATTTTGLGAAASPAGTTTTTASSTTTSTTTPATTSTTSPTASFALVLRATTADVWVELTAVDTGRVLHAGVVAKGGSLDVKVEGPVNAVIGRPEAVAVTVDGQTVAPPLAFKWRITSSGIEQRG